VRQWTGFNCITPSGKKLLKKDVVNWILQLLHIIVRHHQSYHLSFAVEAIITAVTEEVNVATAHKHYIIQITNDVAPLCHRSTSVDTWGLMWIIYPVHVICKHTKPTAVLSMNTVWVWNIICHSDERLENVCAA